MRRLARWFALGLVLLLAVPLLYLAAALVLGLWAVNPGWQPTPEERGGIPVWLRTNGVHADLVLPAAAPHDFMQTFPRTALIDFRREARPLSFNWIAYGRADRAIYLNTPTWSELDAGTAVRALSGQGPSAMHVEYLRRPEDYDAQLLWLSADEYADLVAYVLGGFARGTAERPRRIDHPGYFATDAFFEGEGSYSLVLTSNEWVRRGLAHAGVRTARWAPFDRALMWQARR